jgi:deoxyadenosine/deoxycytidine kinase
MKTDGLLNPFSPDSNLDNYFGRDKELALLETFFIKEKHTVVVISGINAVGKTSLWRVFLRSHPKVFDGKVQVFSAAPRFEGFSKIDDKIKLVVIDDISYDYNDRLENDIIDLLKTHPQKQFLLVGANINNLKRVISDSHIHLDALQKLESNQFLEELLEIKLPQKDILRIANLSKGNPYLLKLFSYYINQNKYSLEQIFNLVNQDFSQKGIIDKSGFEISDTSAAFKHITSDIQIVNKSILDKIRFRPEDIHQLHSRQFEEMVAELMEKRGYNVDLTKATHDGGKDLIIAHQADIGNFIYYVECKRYAPTNPVGVNLVRELAGTISVDRVTAGIMVTSSYFSPDAIEFSEKIKNQMSLIDFIKLKEWLKNIK